MFVNVSNVMPGPDKKAIQTPEWIRILPFGHTNIPNASMRKNKIKMRKNSKHNGQVG